MLSKTELLNTWRAVRAHMVQGLSYTKATKDVAFLLCLELPYRPETIRYRVRQAEERLGLPRLGRSTT